MLVGEGRAEPEQRSASCLDQGNASGHFVGAAFDVAMVKNDLVALEAAARDVRFRSFAFNPCSGIIHVDLGRPSLTPGRALREK